MNERWKCDRESKMSSYRSPNRFSRAGYMWRAQWECAACKSICNSMGHRCMMCKKRICCACFDHACRLCMDACPKIKGIAEEGQNANRNDFLEDNDATRRSGVL